MANVTVDNASPLTQDPLVSFNFGIDVQGEIKGFFTEVTGLGSETEVTEHTVVNEKGLQSVKKIPGRLKWSDIVLKKGITADMAMWAWRSEVENGNVDASRRNGSIIMYDQMGQEVARWNFEKGWPSKLDGPKVDSGSSEIGVEELTIVHEYIKRVT